MSRIVCAEAAGFVVQHVLGSPETMQLPLFQLHAVDKSPFCTHAIGRFVLTLSAECERVSAGARGIARSHIAGIRKTHSGRLKRTLRMNHSYARVDRCPFGS